MNKTLKEQIINDLKELNKKPIQTPKEMITALTYMMASYRAVAMSYDQDLVFEIDELDPLKIDSLASRI